jgi:hypothetical protein
MSFPWTLGLSAVLGVALMFVPVLFGVTGRAAEVDQVGGALMLTMATLAMGEPLRLVRYLNVPLGLGILVAPWMLGGAPALAAIISALLGLAVAGLALPRGEIRERYGLWQRFVR